MLASSPAGAQGAPGPPPPPITSRLLRLVVVGKADEVNDDARLVALDPCIVARRNRKRFARPHPHGRSVIHHDGHLTRDHVAQMRGLARCGTRDRLHVLRPLPAGFEPRAPHRRAAHVDDVQTSLRKGTSLFLARKILPPATRKSSHRSVRYSTVLVGTATRFRGASSIAPQRGERVCPGSLKKRPKVGGFASQRGIAASTTPSLR